MADPPCAVAVFVRDPEPGRVKTRLAAAIGAEGAAALYAAFVADLARVLPGAEWALRWWIAPPDRGFARRFAIDPALCRAQRGGDLGERMRAAFAAARDEGFARCVLVGSDMPQLSPAAVVEAFSRLDAADLVLGPADDGGYYLIAMREAHDVFSGIPWSTPRVLEETLARARSLGLRVAQLERGFDVDEPRDLERLQEALGDPSTRARLAATTAALRSLGRPPR